MAVNSGRPYTRTYSVTTTASTMYPPVKSQFAQMRNNGTVDVRIFWDSEDVGTLDRALVLTAKGNDGDFLEGPLELFPVNEQAKPTRGGVTFQTVSGTSTVTCVFYQEGI